MKNELRIKLIFPPAFDEVTMSMPPLGLITLATYLKNNQINVEIEDVLAKIRHYNNSHWFFSPKRIFFESLEKKTINYLFNKPINKRLDKQLTQILELFEYKDYDILGFSIHTYSQLIYALFLAKKIKEQIKTTIVFGGPVITLMGDKFFDEFKFVDYMIKGEGELSFLKLINSLNNKDKAFKKISGLLYRRNHKTYQNDICHTKIKGYYTPLFEFFDLSLYKIRIKNMEQLILPYQISKGCVNKCSFCTHRLLGVFKLKPLDVIIKDIKILKHKYNTRHFFFCDSNINNSEKFLNELCDALIKNKINITWGAFVSVNNLNKELLKKMKKAGCHLLFFGIESGSDRLLQLMNKNYTSKQGSEMLECSYKEGIENIVSFIAGFPSENQKDIKQTVNFIRNNSLYITYPKVIRFMLEYNSEVYTHPERFNITNLKINFMNLFTSRNIVTYDEINGLSWEKIKKQQEESYDVYFKTVFTNIKKPKFNRVLKLMPYSLYKFLSNKRYKKNKFLNYVIYIFYNRRNGLKDYYMPFAYFM